MKASQGRWAVGGARAVEEALQSGSEEMVELRLSRRWKLLREGRDGDEGFGVFNFFKEVNILWHDAVA